MKRLLIFFMVLAMIFLAGCFVAPADPEPDPIPDPDIICVGGHYSVRLIEWSATGCPGDEQVAGTYWINSDGRIFLLGDPVENAMEEFGNCPTSYIEEIFI